MRGYLSSFILKDIKYNQPERLADSRNKKAPDAKHTRGYKLLTISYKLHTVPSIAEQGHG